jgi:hypothetical protein
MAESKEGARTRGPEPDRLKIEGDWEDAVKKALKKKAPERRPPKRKRRK